MISISLFYCCEELFTHINTCMIEKNSMKLHYLKKKITVTWAWNILLVRVACAGVGWGLWGLWGFWGGIWGSVMICVFMAVYYCWMVWLGAFGVFGLGCGNSALLIFSLRRGWRGGRGLSCW